MSRLQDLLQEIRDLELRVAAEISQEAERFGYSIHQGKIYFEQEIASRHATLAQGLSSYLADSSLRVIATAPVVYSLIIPLALLDVFVSLYQAICFPIFKIPGVVRSDYISIDRHTLLYLNLIERAHCLYCSYATGLIAYAQEIGGRTEQYWCPIKHARRLKTAHSRYSRFLSYGDGENYAAELDALRKAYRDLL